MAGNTVRAIFEARVSGARKGMTDLAGDVDKAGRKVDGLTRDLKTLDAQKVKPSIDVQIDEAKKRLSDLTRELGQLKKEPTSPEVEVKIEAAKANIAEVRAEIKDLTSQRTEVRIETGIKDAQKAIKSITNELGLLRTLETSPEVTADIRDAQKRLREARATLRELNNAKASLTVTADTSRAESALDSLQGDIASAGEEGGADAGEGVAKGILDALGTIPVAGAIVGIGAAIGYGLLRGVQDGLSIEADRDLFSARSGLDEATSARFGRAAGSAYADAYGTSVEANLDVARRALAAGIIDADASDAEIEKVISKLTTLTDLFEYDMPMAVQAVGNALKTGLVRDADEAFDLVTAASQRVPSDDLIETINEYSNQFVTMGLDGQQAFGLIVQGAQAGARDTDKVADTLKELGLRAREGLDPAVDALEALGLNAQDTVAAFQEGGPRATAAIGDVFDALRTAKDEGKNTQEIIAALFGGPGEDLGAALFALDIDTATEALGGINGAAGAADRAMATLADNTSTSIESARRNVELAADGIKGALAEAFSDDIEGAADWVSRNRAPIIQFFVDVINGTIDAGIAFAEFSAEALDAIGGLATGLGNFLRFVPGMGDAAKSLREIGSSAKEGADVLREEVPAALEETRGRINTWAGPEILKARLHDATVAMASDMDAFSAKVEASGGTVTINGDKKNAEEVLAVLTENINAEDGTVTINGDRVPADEALAAVLRAVESGEGDITIGGDTSPGEAELVSLKNRVDRTSGDVTIDGNTRPGQRDLGSFQRLVTRTSGSVGIRGNTSSGRGSLESFKATVNRSRASVFVNASTAEAERRIQELVRSRIANVTLRVSGTNSVGGRHDGGIVTGRHAGGKVPGSDPGYDNVLWPLNSGGRTLFQPLAGGEMVVNSTATMQWEPLLQAINAGLKPSQVRGTTYSPTFIAQGLDAQAAIDRSMREYEYRTVAGL